MLIQDTAKCLTDQSELKFVTLPIQTNSGLTIMETTTANCDVKIRDNIYHQGGIQIGSHQIPIFPAKSPMSEFSRQCLRQWIRCIYSEMCSLTTNSDDLLYKFLTEVLKIYLSDIHLDIKTSFVEMALVMLDRRRFASGGVKEIQHLLSGNPPLPNNGSPEVMTAILYDCAKDFGVSPYSLWYGIICMLGIPQLVDNQLPYCLDSLHGDAIDPTTILSCLAKKLSLQISHKVINNVDFEYYDFISLEDTTTTGGYKIGDHALGKFTCRPKYIISDESYLAYKNSLNKCPLCHTPITNYIKVLSKDDYTKTNFLELPEIQSEFFDSRNHVVFDPFESVPAGNNLIFIDDINFFVSSYEISTPYIGHKMNPTKVVNYSKDKFLTAVRRDHNFLLQLDLKNVCLAGGFCTSILLNTKVNDYDFFFYGLEQDNLSDRIKQLTQDIIQQLGGKFIGLYREQTHVFELLRFDERGQQTHRIQQIVRKYDQIRDIFKNFDLDSCCVGFTENSSSDYDIVFCDRSTMAYKYFINIIRPECDSTTFGHRILKYYDRGFDIILPRTESSEISAKLELDTNIEIFGCRFRNCVATGYKIISTSSNHSDSQTRSTGVYTSSKLYYDGDMTYTDIVSSLNQVDNKSNHALINDISDLEAILTKVVGDSVDV